MAEQAQIADGLVVELFLANGRIQGVTHEVRDRTRLGDVLTAPSSCFRLASARMIWESWPAARDIGPINVEKRSILAAIPHENTRQLRERSLQRTTVGRSNTRVVHATVLLPPFIVEGAVHLPPGAGGAGDGVTADPALFARFFAMTDASLTLPKGGTLAASILLVNRDLVAGISARD